MAKYLFVSVLLLPISGFGKNQLSISPGQRIELKAAVSTTVYCGKPEDLNQRCEMAGPGLWNNLSWSYRIATGGEIVSGADSLQEILSQIEQLRINQLCK